MKSLRRIFALCLALFATVNVCAEDDIQEALEAVNTQLQAKPNDAGLLVQRAKLYQQKRAYDQAVADLNQAAKAGGAGELHRERAELFLDAGWHETGLEHANKHLATAPQDPWGHLVRARLNARLGRVKEAGQDYSAALTKMKEPQLDLFLEHAQAMSSAADPHLDEALSTLENGIKKIGPVVTLQSAAIEVELRQNNFDAAISRVDRMLQTIPRKDAWLARKGDILVKAGRVAEAKTAYQQALDAINKLPVAQKNRPQTKELANQIQAQLQEASGLAKRSVVPETKLLQAPPKAAAPPPNEFIAPTNTPALPSGGKLRTYYIAAEEVDWDYAHAGNVLQEPFCGDPDAIPGQAAGRIGTKYRKSIYREYTDGTFQRLKVRSSEWRHLGILGPLIRGEVGDRIKIVFRNQTRTHASIHPHGVFYLKTSEGSGYDDGTGTGDKQDDAVPPGKDFVYEWLVPERSGPGPNDPSSIVWLYHSHVNAGRDSNSGLIGAIIVTAKGKARGDGRPYDVDREFITLFNIFDENQSWHFETNLVKAFGRTNAVQWDDFLFVESNMKHAINGHIFANMPLMIMTEGEKVRWYLLGMGSERDLHTAHWHGNNVLWHGHRTDVVELLPASMKVADMEADNPGMWMYHCHINDHMREGMSARYLVETRRAPLTTAVPPSTIQTNPAPRVFGKPSTNLPPAPSRAGK